jgi:zinc transport system permease protein
MIEYIAELFQTNFAVRTLIVGSLVSACAALLGVSLVLKRCSMIGDGLSHAGFGTMGIAVALGLTSPLMFSVPLVLIAAFFLLRLSKNGDAAIALISVSSLAVGVIMLSRSGGNTDIGSFMFGSILAVSSGDFFVSVVTAAVVIGAYVFFYNRFFAVTFDSDFALAAGIRVGLYNCCLAALTAVIIVLGMRIMGAMLISGLIVFPALSAMRIFGCYKKVTVCSAVISVVCFNAGIVFSYVYDRIHETSTPAGASVVAVNLIVFLLLLFIGKILNKSLIFRQQ